MPTEPQSPEGALRARIRRRMDFGLLPVAVPGVISAGYAAGLTCCACDQPITHDQIDYEVELECGTLELHMGCHGLWQVECVERIRDESGDTHG